MSKGFERVVVDKGSFGGWLRNFPLSKDYISYLHDGSVKSNQQKHYAVLDISVSKKNLQQCAGAFVQLKAEYYFAKKEHTKNIFYNRQK